MKQISSHLHGEGQFRREAWGKRSDCHICTAADKKMAEGQKWIAERKEEEKEKAVNALIGKEVTYA